MVVEANGIRGLSERRVGPVVRVNNLKPDEIWDYADFTTQLGGYCPLIGGGGYLDFWGENMLKIELKGTLLSPFSVSAGANKASGIGKNTTLINSNYVSSTRTIGILRTQYYSDCWMNHYGTIKTWMKVEYAGKTFDYSARDEHYWEGRVPGGGAWTDRMQ